MQFNMFHFVSMGIHGGQQGSLSASRLMAWGGVFPKVLHGKNAQTTRKMSAPIPAKRGKIILTVLSRRIRIDPQGSSRKEG